MSNLNIIKDFCDGNSNNLKKLPDYYKQFLINMARISIKNLNNTSNMKIDVAISILKELDPLDMSILDVFNDNLTILQKQCIEYFYYINSLLIAIPTGFGKTLIAIGITLSYLSKYPTNNVIVLSPASIINNFEKEGNKYGISFKKDSRYHFYSFDTFMNKNKALSYDCTKTLLIIDEAHTLRNLLGIKFQSAMSCALHAHKVLLLTATPLVNSTLDLVAIANLLWQRYIIGVKIAPKQLMIIDEKGIIPDFYKQDPTYMYNISYSRSKPNKTKKQLAEMDKISNLLRYRVIFSYKIESEDFPTYDIYPVYIKMTEKYNSQFDYYMEPNELKTFFLHPEKFYNGYRRAVNKIIDDYFSMKINSILDKLKHGQSIIYSNWIIYGSDIIEKILKQNNILFGVIKGDIPTKTRSELVKKYNNKEINVMIITKAGSEGLDFKNTENLLILDPTWGYSQTEQIIGRAVRYKSHESLPLDNRHVNVYYLILIEPNIDIDNLTDSKSGDVLLYQISTIKEEIVNYSKSYLNELSNETLSTLT